MNTHQAEHKHETPRIGDLPLTLGNLPRLVMLLPIRLYQVTISPGLPANTCLFYPSCSNYSFEAIFRHGAIKGGWLAAKRLLRCNPFNEGGYDPVP